MTAENPSAENPSVERPPVENPSVENPSVERRSSPHPPAEGLPAEILCIAGSPRRRGNSDQLLDAFVSGVEAAGGVARRLVVTSAGVGHCRGCNACSRDGRCIQRDGMDEVYPLLESAAAIAVATPVYFAGVPASLKALYDRCQPYWARRYVLGEPAPAQKRPGALLIVGGGGDPFGWECAATLTKSAFAVLGVAVTQTVTAIGPDKPGDIQEYRTELESAAKAGRAMVAAVAEQRR